MPTIFHTFATFFNLTKAFDIVDQWKVKKQRGAEITGTTKFLGGLGKILTRVLFWSQRHSLN